MKKYEIIQAILQVLGDTEETNILLDYVLDLWETEEILRERLGLEKARQVVDAGMQPQEEWLPQEAQASLSVCSFHPSSTHPPAKGGKQYT